MSFWRTITRGVSTLLFGGSASKTAENLLDKENGLLVQVGGFVNDLHLSDSERLEYNKQIADAAAEFSKSTMSENTVRSRTRRAIAIAWIRVELFLVLLSVASWPYSEEYAAFVFSIAVSTLMLGGTWAVIGFFFGGYYLKGGSASHVFEKALTKIKSNAAK